MITLADPTKCTGCGACAFVCSRRAISMQQNKLGVINPNIDASICVECGLCIKSCPALNPVDKQHPLEAYASWHNDTNERLKSASGGIATAAYKLALTKGIDIAGAKQNRDFSVDIVISDKYESIDEFRNSKYVFSNLYSLYPRLKENINNGKTTLIIALPCQIAAIRKVFRKTDLLILGDVVCHGTTPTSYLQQHIKMLEEKIGIKATKMSFRDPELYTYTYTLSLYDKDGHRFYAKRTKHGDTYQYAYHRMVSYRENCYHCQYANPARVSDFTLCDYSGLGAKYDFEYNRLNTSCILINTPKGKDFLQPLIDSNIVTAIARPLDEPISGNQQLQRPSEKSKSRVDFEEQINKFNGDFEKAINIVIANNCSRDKTEKVLNLPKRIIKALIRRIISK